MLSVALPLVVSLGLLQANALTVPKLRVLGHPHRPRADLLPPWDPPLTSSFQKDGVAATWAPGHPKVFGQEVRGWKLPNPPLPEALSPRATFTDDDKFLIIVNQTDFAVIQLETGAIVSVFPRKYVTRSADLAVSAAPGGQYDVLLGNTNFTFDDKTTQQRISQDGVPVGNVVDHIGSISTSFSNPIATGANGKRLVFTIDFNTVHIYDLDNPNGSGVTLAEHDDTVLSVELSPDKKTVATTGFDGYVKLWDVDTGAQVLVLPPDDPSAAPANQDWLTRFSPDGKSILISIGSPLPDVRIVSLSNPSNVISAGPFNWWVRSAEWTADGSLIALGGGGWVKVIRASDGSVVQTWQIDSEHWPEAQYLHWYDNDSKLRWSIENTTMAYDFNANLLYSWGEGYLADLPDVRFVTPTGNSYILEEQGLIGTIDSDNSVRVWTL